MGSNGAKIHATEPSSAQLASSLRPSGPPSGDHERDRLAVSLEAASAALGHTDLSTTMRHYGHWQPDELAEAFDALAAERRS
jgi:integrase